MLFPDLGNSRTHLVHGFGHELLRFIWKATQSDKPLACLKSPIKVSKFSSILSSYEFMRILERVNGWDCSANMHQWKMKEFSRPNILSFKVHSKKYILYLYIKMYYQSYFHNYRILCTEAYTSLDMLLKYFGNSTYKSAHFPFYFGFVDFNYQQNAADLNEKIHQFMDEMPKHGVANWVVSFQIFSHQFHFSYEVGNRDRTVVQRAIPFAYP